MCGNLNSESGSCRKEKKTDQQTRNFHEEFGFEKYQRLMVSSDLSEAEKIEFLKSLAVIIVGFVDLGYNNCPAQQALRGKNQSSKANELADVISKLN